MEDSKYFIAILFCLWNYVHLYSVFIGRISRSSIFMERVDSNEIQLRCFE